MAARSKQARKRRTKGRRADYRGASPEQVAEAGLRFQAQPGMKSKRFINPDRG